MQVSDFVAEASLCAKVVGHPNVAAFVGACVEVKLFDIISCC